MTKELSDVTFDQVKEEVGIVSLENRDNTVYNLETNSIKIESNNDDDLSNTIIVEYKGLKVTFMSNNILYKAFVPYMEYRLNKDKLEDIRLIDYGTYINLIIIKDDDLWDLKDVTITVELVHALNLLVKQHLVTIKDFFTNGITFSK